MSTRTRLTVAVIGLCLAGTVLPASAATSGTTTDSVTITGGTLSITVPGAAGSLGSTPDTVGGATISGPLGQVQVLDARDAAAGSGWVASAISTALTPSAGPTIPASDIGYTCGAITQAGTATYTADDPAALTGVSAVLTATGITGDNSATWNPTITVHVPGGMASGTYTGTITQSVA
jgi:hypothetical protein